MVLVQKWPFIELFLRQYRPGKCLLWYCRTKKRLPNQKNQEVQKVEKLTFFHGGLTHGFRPKMAIFRTFFLRNVDQENVFYDIQERKNDFLGYKNKKFKKSKNWHLSKGVNPWFWSKNGHFSNFFFRQYRLGKCLLWYSRTKKRLSRL